jgi:hypothetical protein
MAKKPQKKGEIRVGIPQDLLLFDHHTDKDLVRTDIEVHFRFASYRRTKTALYLKYELVKTEKPIRCSK